MREVRQRVRHFLVSRPKTSIFLGTTLFFGSLPITILTTIIIGVSVSLGTAFLLVQGTVVAFSVASLVTALSGPLCLAGLVTLVFHAVRNVYLGLRVLVFRTTTKCTGLFKQFTGKSSQSSMDKTDINDKNTGDNYICEFCRANLHELCVSRKLRCQEQ